MLSPFLGLWELPGCWREPSHHSCPPHHLMKLLFAVWRHDDVVTLVLAQVLPVISGLCGTCRSQQVVVSPLLRWMLVGGWAGSWGDRKEVKVYKRRYHCSGKELPHHITPYCNLLLGVTGATMLTAPWSSRLLQDPSAADWSVLGWLWPCWGQRGHISPLKMKCNKIWLCTPTSRLLPILLLCDVAVTHLPQRCVIQHAQGGRSQPVTDLPVAKGSLVPRTSQVLLLSSHVDDIMTNIFHPPNEFMPRLELRSHNDKYISASVWWTSMMSWWHHRSVPTLALM